MKLIFEAEDIIALGAAIVSILIAIGVVIGKVSALEGTPLIISLVGGGILSRIILSRSRRNRRAQ